MPLQRQGIKLTTDLHVSDKVRVDVSQMKQVLFNIFRNARDAMPKGGELRVSTGRGTIRSKESDLRARDGTIDSKESDLRASTPTSYETVYVEVEDTGRGIESQYLERIFDPFFTMHREGSGLGLAISRKIVENHGGTIEVESEPGKGTRFAVVLPTV
jgi:two-component system sensor histidine kinase AtoS